MSNKESLPQPDNAALVEAYLTQVFAYINEHQLSGQELTYVFNQGLVDICLKLGGNPLPAIDTVLRKHSAGIYISAKEIELFGPEFVAKHPNLGEQELPYAIWTNFGDDAAVLAERGRTIEDNTRALEQTGFLTFRQDSPIPRMIAAKTI